MTVVVRPQCSGVTVRVPGPRATAATVRQVQIKVQMPHTSVRVAPQPLTLRIPTAAPGPPGPAGRPTLTALSGANLSGHRAVYLAGGKAFYASARGAGVRVVAGITLAAALTDQPIEIQLAGEINEPSWSWTPEEPVYLGESGLITQAPAMAHALLELGFALTSTSMVVRIQQPIFLSE